jgi:hypothetical protein
MGNTNSVEITFNKVQCMYISTITSVRKYSWFNYESDKFYTIKFTYDSSKSLKHFLRDNRRKSITYKIYYDIHIDELTSNMQVLQLNNRYDICIAYSRPFCMSCCGNFETSDGLPFRHYTDKNIILIRNNDMIVISLVPNYIQCYVYQDCKDIIRRDISGHILSKLNTKYGIFKRKYIDRLIYSHHVY